MDSLKILGQSSGIGALSNGIERIAAKIWKHEARIGETQISWSLGVKRAVSFNPEPDL